MCYVEILLCAIELQACAYVLSRVTEMKKTFRETSKTLFTHTTAKKCKQHRDTEAIGATIRIHQIYGARLIAHQLLLLVTRSSISFRRSLISLENSTARASTHGHL